jgi:hypothetical protein
VPADRYAGALHTGVAREGGSARGRGADFGQDSQQARVEACHRPRPDQHLPATGAIDAGPRVGRVQRDAEPGARLVGHRVKREQRHAHAPVEPLGEMLERHVGPLLDDSPLLADELGRRAATMLRPRGPTQSPRDDHARPAGIALRGPLLDRRERETERL